MKKEQMDLEEVLMTEDIYNMSGELDLEDLDDYDLDDKYDFSEYLENEQIRYREAFFEMMEGEDN